MQARQLPIVEEIEGYERAPGGYVIHSGCHLADFERVSVHGLEHHATPVSETGEMMVEGKGTGLMVNDYTHLKQTEALYFFVDLAWANSAGTSWTFTTSSTMKYISSKKPTRYAVSVWVINTRSTFLKIQPLSSSKASIKRVQ
jgi:hypothetical protein